MGGAQVMKRIPMIKFPQRHKISSVRMFLEVYSSSGHSAPFPSLWLTSYNLLCSSIIVASAFRQSYDVTSPFPMTSSAPRAQATSTAGDTNQIVISRSNVSRTPYTLAPGGKASAQLKRTPVSAEEIQAILLGGCF